MQSLVSPSVLNLSNYQPEKKYTFMLVAAFSEASNVTYGNRKKNDNGENEKSNKKLKNR